MDESHPRPHTKVCPYFPGVDWFLDNPFRRFFLNPDQLLGSLVREGMTVIDLGCGPGMFTLAMAERVGERGQVIAVDLQQGMLDLVKKKAKRKGLAPRIRLHRNTADSIGLAVQADFILSVYMVHEVSNQELFFREVHGLLAPEGRYLVKEPIFIGKKAFAGMGAHARSAGLEPLEWVNGRFTHKALFGPQPGPAVLMRDPDFGGCPVF
ncbi:MAG: class I SAM-dependent methyltransferase [Methanomicrobiales archaeon]|nr:class I SAM-dependent methyltransferase [Methanomicrobiales archaeon]